MPRHPANHRTTLAAVGVLAAGVATMLAGPADAQHARLVARSVLPAATYRDGSPPSGGFLSAAERQTAAANGVPGAASGPYLPAQPVQGFSSMVPADAGTWWALSDNGYAWRANSADFQLVFYRLDPRWGDPGGPRVLETVVLHDPDRRIPWTIVCDRASGTPLPGFSFNVLPAAPAACGGEPAARILTGFDLDPESFVRAPDGTFWVSEEFGPFLLHVAADGRVLESPVPIPGVSARTGTSSACRSTRSSRCTWSTSARCWSPPTTTSRSPAGAPAPAAAAEAARSSPTTPTSSSSASERGSTPTDGCPWLAGSTGSRVPEV